MVAGQEPRRLEEGGVVIPSNYAQARHEERMKDPAYRAGYEEASAQIKQGTVDLDCGCVALVATGATIFGPVDCKEHGDE